MSILNFGKAANPPKESASTPDDILAGLFGIEGVPPNRTVFTTVCALRDYHASDLSENADSRTFVMLKNHIEEKCAFFNFYKDGLPLDREEPVVFSAWLLARYYLLAPKADSWEMVDPNVKELLDFFDAPENNMLVMGDVFTRHNIFDSRAAGQALLIGLMNLFHFGEAMGRYEKEGINRADPQARNDLAHQTIHAMRVLSDRPGTRPQLLADCQTVGHQLVRFARHLPGHKAGGHLRLV